MDTPDEEQVKEIKVYVCWEYGPKQSRKTDPILLRVGESAWKGAELVGFANHPMRAEILALANLAGRDNGDAAQLGVTEDRRSRFSEDFYLPADWFDGCTWR
ncbi:hypothetical protein D3C87_1133470 [compost metagenome]